MEWHHCSNDSCLKTKQNKLTTQKAGTVVNKIASLETIMTIY